MGIKLNCLIDTGSTLSILHPSKYHAMSDSVKPKLSSYHGKLRMADGGIVVPLGTAQFPVQLSNKTIYYDLVIADVDAPMIIGFDFLSSNKCILNMGDGTLKIHGEEILCNFENSLSSVYKISASENVEIPPSSEMILLGKIQNGLPHMVNGFIEPLDCDIMEKGCLVAKSIVDPSCQTIPIRVINLSSQPVQLYKQTTIAQCSLIKGKSVTDIPDIQSPLHKCVFHVSKDHGKLPEHLKELYMSSKTDLNEEQQCKFFNLLIKYQNVFSKNRSDLGKTDLVQHKIDTGDAVPFKMQPRRLPLAKREAVKTEIDRLLNDGIIEPSNGPWASQTVLVTKPDGTSRLCIDYRKLNDVTRKDSYPLPLISDSLDTLGGSSWFSSMDLSSGYYQVQMDPNHKEKTAFTSYEGLYQFKYLSFGLCNAVATFERLMEFVLRGLHWKTCILTT